MKPGTLSMLLQPKLSLWNMSWVPDHKGKMANFPPLPEKKNSISYKVLRAENTLLVEVQYLVQLIPKALISSYFMSLFQQGL